MKNTLYRFHAQRLFDRDVYSSHRACDILLFFFSFNPIMLVEKEIRVPYINNGATVPYSCAL